MGLYHPLSFFAGMVTSHPNTTAMMWLRYRGRWYELRWVNISACLKISCELS